MNNPTQLSQQMIIAALTRLGAIAQAAGSPPLRLVVAGGAALVLHYGSRGSTHDIDVYIDVPPERRNTRAWAETVARELRLPSDWLNDGVTGFMNEVTIGPLLLDAPGIQVYQVSDEQLLAMKLSAWRTEQDINDAAIVMQELVKSYPDQALLWQAIMPYVNDMKAQYAFIQLWEDLYG